MNMTSTQNHEDENNLKEIKQAIKQFITNIEESEYFDISDDFNVDNFIDANTEDTDYLRIYCDHFDDIIIKKQKDGNAIIFIIDDTLIKHKNDIVKAIESIVYDIENQDIDCDIDDFYGDYWRMQEYIHEYKETYQRCANELLEAICE